MYRHAEGMPEEVNDAENKIDNLQDFGPSQKIFLQMCCISFIIIYLKDSHSLYTGVTVQYYLHIIALSYEITFAKTTFIWRGEELVAILSSIAIEKQ